MNAQGPRRNLCDRTYVACSSYSRPSFSLPPKLNTAAGAGCLCKEVAQGVTAALAGTGLSCLRFETFALPPSSGAFSQVTSPGLGSFIWKNGHTSQGTYIIEVFWALIAAIWVKHLSLAPGKRSVNASPS